MEKKPKSGAQKRRESKQKKEFVSSLPKVTEFFTSKPCEKEKEIEEEFNVEEQGKDKCDAEKKQDVKITSHDQSSSELENDIQNLVGVNSDENWKELSNNRLEDFKSDPNISAAHDDKKSTVSSFEHQKEVSLQELSELTLGMLINFKINSNDIFLIN